MMDAQGASAVALDAMFTIPWKSFSCLNFSGLVKYATTPTTVTIMATNLRCLFKETLDEDALQDRCRDLNPSIEVTTKGLVRHLSDGLTAAIERSSKHSPELTATIDSSSLVLALSIAIGEVKFLWNFTMAAQSADDFYSQVTLPMLVMLAAMKEQRERLFALLSKKDAEIKDYTSSGARASKRSLRTLPFDEAEFKEETTRAGVLKRHFANLTESAFAGDELGKIMKAYQELSTLSPQKSSSPSDKELPAESSEQTSVPIDGMHNSTPVQSKALSPEVTPEKPKIKKAKKRLRL
ncbi:non-homologous end-joining factor 1 isoform X1 [Rhipicephalus sanguineus]|uniref:non-homologous end-joining factor 1 isoform X1 n=1 Tax=Rhipicephalus sanguineus TaxID=34632 RepID=UPI001893B6DE|nr:non-homologous end-joining factor 1 isoform X1 [Rhipicephalus sanguineus]